VKPTTRSSLQSINGIGQAKLEKYAEDLLRIIA
jgi:superfamily II DNA helicase RecQ